MISNVIKKFLQLSHDTIILFNKDLIIQEWNESAESQFGFSRANVLGKHLYKILPDFKEHFDFYISTAVLKEGRDINLAETMVLTPKSKKSIPCKVRISQLNSEAKEILLGLFIQQTFNSPSENDEYFNLVNSVILNTKDAILISQAEPLDNPEGPKILFANPAFYEMTGYSEEEVLGKTPRILQGKYTSSETKKEIKDALKVWQPVQKEILNYRKDGTEFWAELSIVPVANSEGWYTHWIAIQRDTTVRRKMENQLKEYSENLEKIIEDRTSEIEILHKNELELKKQKLLISEMKISEKVLLLNKVRTRLEEIKNEPDNKQHIQYLIHSIETQSIEEEVWDSFVMHFEEIHSGFFKKLEEYCKEPLTLTLKKHCAFIKLNLTAKEVASILHIEPKSVEMARYRLKKYLDPGSKKSILQIIEEIE